MESVYLGLARTGWTVSAGSSHSQQFSADKAIDGDVSTFWHTSWAEPADDHPHSITIDLGQTEKLSGFSYLPRQDRKIPDSMIESGFVELSAGGKKWIKVCEFTFGNLLNSPDQRIEFFDNIHNARYFRLTSTSGAAGKPYAGAAEIEIIAAGP